MTPLEPLALALSALASLPLLRAKGLRAAAKRPSAKAKAKAKDKAKGQTGGPAAPEPGAGGARAARVFRGFKSTPAGWPDWNFAPMGTLLELLKGDAERAARRKDHDLALRLWESLRSLAGFAFGPGDPRACAALNRAARSFLGLEGEKLMPYRPGWAAACAAGALEGFRGLKAAAGAASAGGGSERAPGGLAGDPFGPEKAFAERTLALASEARAAVANEASGSGGPAAPPCCAAPARRPEDPAGDPLAARFPPPPCFSAVEAMWPGPPAPPSPSAAFELRRAYSEAEGTYGPASGEALSAKSLLGARTAFELSASGVPAGSEAFAEAGAMLREASEGLAALAGAADARTLAAKSRLAAFLAGEAGPERVRVPCADSVTPEGDLAEAHGLCMEIMAVTPVGREGQETRLAAARAAGRILERQGREDSAAALRARYAGSMEGVLDPRHPLMTGLMHECAESRLAAKRPDDALSLFLDALEARRATLGCRSREAAATLVRLADLEREGGLFVSASAHLSEAVEAMEASGGPEDADALCLKVKLARCFSAAGEEGLALAALERAVPALSRARGISVRESLQGAACLAFSRLKCGNAREAEPAFRAVLSDPRLPGLDPSLHAFVLHGLGASLMELGKDPDEARAAFEHELAVRGRLHGADNRRALDALFNSARAAEATGDLREAMRLHERALESRKRALGLFHPDTERSVEAVGALAGKMANAGAHCGEGGPGAAGVAGGARGEGG
ncbi:MAG: tetratricopeptide repeat protein [Deltaproteobacteria bacterium]|jgi:tetratricopeptide (TPR) repeat protein|nr:tetratricopeptide repeat protein [Deltaproteobacteria bacterium]